MHCSHPCTVYISQIQHVLINYINTKLQIIENLHLLSFYLHKIIINVILALFLNAPIYIYGQKYIKLSDVKMHAK